MSIYEIIIGKDMPPENKNTSNFIYLFILFIYLLIYLFIYFIYLFILFKLVNTLNHESQNIILFWS